MVPSSTSKILAPLGAGTAIKEAVPTALKAIQQNLVRERSGGSQLRSLSDRIEFLTYPPGTSIVPSDSNRLPLTKVA